MLDVAGKSPAQVAKVLGKPKEAHGALGGDDDSDADYVMPSGTKVKVRYAGEAWDDGLAHKAISIKIELKVPSKSWKEAFGAVGMSADSTTTREETPEWTDIKGIEGFPPKRWAANFYSKKPKEITFCHAGILGADVVKWIRE